MLGRLTPHRKCGTPHLDLSAFETTYFTVISYVSEFTGDERTYRRQHANCVEDSSTEAMPALPTLSAPGWTQSTIAVVAILYQLNSLYDPSSFMATYDVPSVPAARLNGKTASPP
jgi:hypothetical protein